MKNCFCEGRLLTGRFKANQVCLVSLRTEVCNGGLVKDADQRRPRPGPKRLQPAGRLEFAGLVVVRADATHRGDSAVESPDDLTRRNQGRRTRQTIAADGAHLTGHKPRILERLEDLLEIFDRHVPPVGLSAARFSFLACCARKNSLAPLTYFLFWEKF